MGEFILNAILGTLAIYGLIEIIKVCILSFKFKNKQFVEEVEMKLENEKNEDTESEEKHL